jgi:hypothetical protein
MPTKLLQKTCLSLGFGPVLTILAIMAFSAIFISCIKTPDGVCRHKSGEVTCGYCGLDVATSSNPNAGKCLYCPTGYYCSGTPCGGISCKAGAGGSGSGTKQHQFLEIPNAVFASGKPSGSSSNTSQKIKITAPSSTTYSVGQKLTWTVDFTQVTDITVTDIIIEVDELDGYFDVPLTQAEIDSGVIAIQTELVNQEPSSGQICNRDYRGNGTCYGVASADNGVTSMDFSAADYVEGGATFSVTASVEATVTIDTVETANAGQAGNAGNSGGSGGGTSGGNTGGGNCTSSYMICSACKIQSCCDSSNNCWYVYNGTTYSTGAMNQIAQACVSACGY